MSNYPFETFPLTKRIGIVNPVANLDARYGPWPTLNDALTGFSTALRERGLTVAVSAVGGITEYWYKNGITNSDLILKSAEANSILSTVTNYLSTNQVKVASLSATGTIDVIDVQASNNVFASTFNGMTVFTDGYFNNSVGVESGTSFVQLGPDSETNYDTGSRNTFLGYAAGLSNTAGYQNTYIGTDSGQQSLSGHDNVGVGHSSLASNKHGNYNCALGVGALGALQNGRSNVAIGHGAAGAALSGESNISIGYLANYQLNSNTSNNIVIGKQASSSTFSNTIVIGTSATATSNNSFTVGNSSTPLQTRINGSLTTVGDISGNSNRVSFNQGTVFGNYCLAEGQGTAIGNYSHAEGQATIAFGNYSHAEGLNTTAVGNNSHSEGQNTTAVGNNSHAEGLRTTASEENSHAEGVDTIASGNASHAEGNLTIASGMFAHAEGTGSKAFGLASHAEGTSNAVGYITHAEGEASVATAQAHAEGFFTIAAGFGSHSEGQYTVAGNPLNIVSYNSTTKVFTLDSSAGQFITFFNIGAYLVGRYRNQPWENFTTFYAKITGTDVFSLTLSASDTNLTNSIDPSKIGTIIDNQGAAHAEGSSTLASGLFSHAEGAGTVASGNSSHAEGQATIASGEFGSHAEGAGTIAFGDISHAEGYYSKAIGRASHAAGYKAAAQQDYTYAWTDGLLGTNVLDISTTRSGQYMVSASGGMFIPGNVGIGTDNNQNALTVFGNISASGNIKAESSTIPVTVIDTSLTRVFTNSDSNKIFHFNTTQPLTAMFPSTLSEGFNVAIMNVGTMALHLSAGSGLTYKALGNKLTDTYASAYVYKSGSSLFATGGL